MVGRRRRRHPAHLTLQSVQGESQQGRSGREAVTDHKVSSILACANLTRLYGGHGAQLLERDELSEPALNPPAYDDVGLHLI